MNLDVEYAEYRNYIEEFAKTIDPHDQLPLRVSGYCLRDYECQGEIVSWLITYLGRTCPTTLRIYLVKTALKRILEKVNDSPEECGYDANRDIYQPLKLVKVVVAVVNNIIFELQDNAKLYEVPLPPTSENASELTKLQQPPKVSVDAIKNSRRTMEDRHVILDDFNGFFNIQDSEPTFYYGIFDGHSGSDAATYASSHLNYNISVHPSYPSDIKKAMSAAFLVTDIEFLKKAQIENLSSGTTALCAIYRKTQKKLFVGWCGDSQALIARLGNVHQIVKKHSPEDAAERKRIEDLGGIVLYWSNSYRVNGQLAVSRAIGDAAHKPFVSAEPDIAVLDLDGQEDFIVLACDGLWDSLTEDDVALTVYKKLKEDPNNYQTIATDLCTLAKSQGSRDNISVIVVYLKEPELIATQSWPSEITQNKDIMENLNLYESEQVAPSQQQPAIVSLDALGNTNQDIFNNPFGDFNNQLISNVTMAKSTEITDMVMQQQPENEFCTLTDTLTSNLNNINNNKITNGSHADEIFSSIDNEQQQQQQQPQSDQNVLILNDDNNNSNDNFNNPDLGPETDVDAIEDDDDFNYHAGSETASGGEKEKTQMEFKETDDVTDHMQMNFGSEIVADNAMIVGNSSLGNKIFEELSLHNPDMMSGGINPFAGNEFTDNSAAENITDNKLMEEQIDEMQQELKQEIEYGANDFIENVEHEIDFVAHEQDTAPPAAEVVEANDFASELEQESISANDEVNEEVAIHEEKEQQQPDLGIIGTATQGIEESEEGSDDEWNYIKVEDKKVDTETEDNIPQQQSPTFVEQHEVLEEEKEDQETAPIEDTDIAAAVDENIVQKHFEENFTESDNKFMEEHDQQQHIKEDILIEREQQPIESPVTEEEKDFEQEKEPSVEERHVSDEIEKDLELQVEADNMDSQLNPDAQEFVPLSPVRNEFQSPPPHIDGKSPFVNPILSNFHDPVVAQSPRKGESLIMADDVPEENDFEKEASERPHEVDFMDENFQRIESPNQNELNLKEAMQVDDKLEQEYKDDSQGFFEEEKQQGSEVYTELEKSFSQYSNGFQNNIDDPMNRSFYEGRDSDILADPAKNVLNITQPLPDEEELAATPEIQSTENQEIDLLSSGEPNASQMESSDNFEVEKFVEEIKGVEENKYVDSGLSPTIPDIISHESSTVEETIGSQSPVKETLDNFPETFITQTLTVSDIEIPQQIEQELSTEIQHNDIKENIPEEVIEQNIEPVIEPEQIQKSATIQQEAPVETQQEPIAATVTEDAKIEEPKSENIAAAAVASGVAVAAAAATTALAQKKSASTAKPDAKKVTDSKAKVAPKSTDNKKAEVKPKTTAAKPAPVSKTSVSKTSTAQVKASVPSSASSAASRPKTIASAPASSVKKIPSTSAPKAAPKTTTETKPTPASRTVTAPKRPASVSSAPASKPATAKPAIDVKAKIERKPLASSAPATRAPPKPTTLAPKPKLNGTTSTVKSPASTRPATNARLNASATEKSLSSPLKEKVLNKSASAATPGRSPRPTSALVTAKTTAKTDLKSPSTATKTTSLSAVGTKKPLTITKKPSPTDKTVTKTTITTVTKKPVSKTTASSTVKKTTTTTTTVVKKKVLNGDVVSEETSTTTKTTGDDILALNGHSNGNGIAENGNGIHEEEEQQQQQPVIEPSLI